VIVRKYEEADRESVAALDVDTLVETVADVRLHDGTFSWREVALPEPTIKHHDLAHYLAEASAWDHALVAALDRRICGFAAYRFSAWNRRLVLLHLYVAAESRGHGIGRALLDGILNEARADDAQHAWLETQTNNVPAIRAYERMGFRIAGLDQTLYADRPDAETALYMSRRLAD
jgi:ribosomal protein S18 acetylase RimI-like enzyme